ncbi:MAG TPA: hypothetical protein VGF69_12735 [Thermoanaerobaculia bacterium]
MRLAKRMRLGLALFLILLPLAANAQTPRTGLRDRDPELDASKRIASDLQRATWRSGRFYLLSQFRLADIGYDDEFFVPTSDHGGGLTVSVEAPHRLYYAPTKKVIFSGELVPGYSFFREGTRDTQFNLRGRVDTHFLFNHIYLDVYGAKAQFIAAETSEINRLLTQQQDEVGVAGEFKWSSRTSVIFHGNYEDFGHPLDKFQPADIPVELLDRDARNFRVGLRHRTFPLTALTVAAEQSNYGFRYATYKDSRRDYAGAGFQYDSGRTRMRFEAGPGRLTFRDPKQREFKGVLGSFDVGRTTRRWGFSGMARRDLQFSILANQNFYVSNRGGASADFLATPRLTLRVATARERTAYDAPDVNGVERRDDISFDSVGFRWNRRHFLIGLDVGWYERESTTLGDDESGIRTILHLSFTP